MIKVFEIILCMYLKTISPDVVCVVWGALDSYNELASSGWVELGIVKY